jgi:hypothetical protein
MLQRNLLYTGVTRGKRLVVLVGRLPAILRKCARFYSPSADPRSLCCASGRGHPPASSTPPFWLIPSRTYRLVRWQFRVASCLQKREANMDIEIHAPSTIVLVVSFGLAVFALIYFFMASPDNVSVAFWMAIMAYGRGARHHGKNLAVPQRNRACFHRPTPGVQHNRRRKAADYVSARRGTKAATTRGRGAPSQAGRLSGRVSFSNGSCRRPCRHSVGRRWPADGY